MKDGEEDSGGDVPDGFCERSPQGRYLRTNDLLSESTEKSTYRGFDTRNAIEVAWHILRLDALTTGDIRRLSVYTDIISKLDNPRIIEYHTAWKNLDRHEVVIITETTAAGSLRTFLQKLSVIRWRTIKKWCRQILRGLNYLHSLDPPVIHRDLNCDHIYINSGRAGDLRIGDLWLSSELTQEISNNVSWQNLWAPPETQEGVNDTKTDIFAYGMCVLEMITRQSPFNKEMEDADGVEDEHRARRRVWQAVRKGGYPYAFYLIETEVARNFIARCLAPHDQRPDAETLLEDPFLQPDDSLDDLEVTLIDPTSVPTDISRVSSDDSPADEVLPHPAACGAAEIEELLQLFPDMEDIQKDVRLLEGRVDEDEEDVSRKTGPSTSPPPSQSKKSPRPQVSPGTTAARSDHRRTGTAPQVPQNSPPAIVPTTAPSTQTQPAVDVPTSVDDAEKVTVELQMGENLVVFDFEVGVDSYETVASEMKEQLHLKGIDTPQLATMIEEYVQSHTHTQQDAAETSAGASTAARAPSTPMSPTATATRTEVAPSHSTPEQSLQRAERARSPSQTLESGASKLTEQVTTAHGQELQKPILAETSSEPTSGKKLRAVLSSESLSSEPGATRQTDSCDEEDVGRRDEDSQKELLRAQHVFNFRRKKLEDSQSNYQQEGEKLTIAYEKEVREITDKMLKLVQERDEQIAMLTQEIQARRLEHLAKCREDKYQREAQRRIQSQQLHQRQQEQQQRMLQQYWLINMPPQMMHPQQFAQMPNFGTMPTPSVQDWEVLNSSLAPEDRAPYPLQFLQQQQTANHSPLP